MGKLWGDVLTTGAIMDRSLHHAQSIKLDKGLSETYFWIKQQYEKRQAGERVGIG